MSDSIEDPEAHIAEMLQSPEEESYLQAKAGFEFPSGHFLHPYTPSRRVAAQSMGMLYPFVSEAAVAQQESTGLYAGQLRDMIILLWVCSQKDPSDLTLEEVKAGAWTPSRASMKPDQAMERAMAWAEEVHLVNMMSKEFRLAINVFMAIVTGVDAAEFKLQMEENSEPKEEEQSDSKKA